MKYKLIDLSKTPDYQFSNCAGLEYQFRGGVCETESAAVIAALDGQPELCVRVEEQPVVEQPKRRSRGNNVTMEVAESETSKGDYNLGTDTGEPR